MNIGFLYAVTTTMLNPTNFDKIKDVLTIDREKLHAQIILIEDKKNSKAQIEELKAYILTGSHTTDLSLESLKNPSKAGLDFIENRKGVPSKRELDALSSIYKIPKGLLYSVMIKESNGNKNALSNKRAKGLFQFTPETAKEFGLFDNGVDKRTDEWLSAEASARYLAWIFTYFHNEKDRSDINNYRYVLAGYNAGIGKVKKGKTLSIPNYKETQDYVRLVIGYAEGKYYKVKRGDKFKQIASSTGLSQSRLSAMNNGINQMNLVAEKYLLIDTTENDINYIVKKGDTIYGIAKRHSTSVESLMLTNALSNNIIKIGQKLSIPY